MKSKWILFLAMGLLLFVGCENNKDAIAIVNGEKILISEYRKLYNPYRGEPGVQTPEDELLSVDDEIETKRMILESMIHYELCREDLKKQNQMPSQEDLDAEMKEMRESIANEKGMEYEEFLKTLQVSDEVWTDMMVRSYILQLHEAWFDSDRPGNDYDAYLAELRANSTIEYRIDGFGPETE